MKRTPVGLVLVLSGCAQAPSEDISTATVPEGTFCELIGAPEAERISCFQIEQGEDGLILEGTAHRVPERGGVLATWALTGVEGWDPDTRTLSYRYEARFPAPDRTVSGESVITLPTDGQPGEGWYTTGERRTVFSVWTLAALNRCTGRPDGSGMADVGDIPVAALRGCGVE